MCTFLFLIGTKFSYHECVNLFVVHLFIKFFQESADLCGRYNPNLCGVTYDPGKICEIVDIISSYGMQFANSNHYP